MLSHFVCPTNISRSPKPHKIQVTERLVKKNFKGHIDIRCYTSNEARGMFTFYVTERLVKKIFKGHIDIRCYTSNEARGMFTFYVFANLLLCTGA